MCPDLCQGLEIQEEQGKIFTLNKLTSQWGGHRSNWQLYLSVTDFLLTRYPDASGETVVSYQHPCVFRDDFLEMETSELWAPHIAIAKFSAWYHAAGISTINCYGAGDTDSFYIFWKQESLIWTFCLPLRPWPDSTSGCVSGVTFPGNLPPHCSAIVQIFHLSPTVTACLLLYVRRHWASVDNSWRILGPPSTQLVSSNGPTVPRIPQTS